MTRPMITTILLHLFTAVPAQAAAFSYQTRTWPLGQPNLTAAEGNPMKGMVPSPDWTAPPYLQSVPSSLEYYYIALNQLMNTSLSDFSGVDTYLEPRLAGSAARARHAVLRVYIDYPTRPTGVPYFLVADGLAFNTYSEHGGGESPDYTSEALLQALEAFIAHLGARYDGDPRLAFIQVGLLGFWGEWHTFPHSSWLPAEAKNRVVAGNWYIYPSCCPLHPVRPLSCRSQRENPILGVTYGVLLWADMNAANLLGAWGRLVISLVVAAFKAFKAAFSATQLNVRVFNHISYYYTVVSHKIAYNVGNVVKTDEVVRTNGGTDWQHSRPPSPPHSSTCGYRGRRPFPSQGLDSTTIALPTAHLMELPTVEFPRLGSSGPL